MKKIPDLVFIASIAIVISIQYLIRNFIFPGNTTNYSSSLLDSIFNILLGICLIAFYIKKYTPDKFRIVLMCVFIFELIIGIFLRKLMLPYGTATMLLGLIGVVATWKYTHTNRLRFSQKNNN